MDHPVTLSVTNTGDFTYSPTHVRAAPGDTITFSAGGSQFAVMFKRTSPGDKIHLHNASARVDATNVGVHQYGAAIWDGNRVFVDGGCGDVGVGN